MGGQTVGKWLIHDPKHRMDNRWQRPKHPATYPNWKCKHDTEEFHSNEFNRILQMKVLVQKHPLEM